PKRAALLSVNSGQGSRIPGQAGIREPSWERGASFGRDQRRTGEAAGATVGTTTDIAVAHIFRSITDWEALTLGPAWLAVSQRAVCEDRNVVLAEDLDTSALTPRQRGILTVIRDRVVRYGYPPSTREIGDAVGLASTSSVSRHLRVLEELGFLR